MLQCINKNLIEYQTLKDRSGIPIPILDAMCRLFLTKYNRFPHLDELPNVDSSKHLKTKLKVDLYGGAKIDVILELTGTTSIEDAVITINNAYRDLETTITPIRTEAIINITSRPTDTNFTEEEIERDYILLNAPRDSDGHLLAPNGNISNLTEEQYIHVRTKAFKRWFGDWESFAKINSAVVIWGHPGTGKTWMFNNDNEGIIDFDSEYKVRLNKLAGLPEGASAKELRKAWKKENKRLYLDLINSLFDEAVKEAKRTGKKLLVSDLHLLTERINDIDIVTNISDLEFIKRSHERGEHDEDNKMLWKNDINQAIARVPKSKIITMSGRISDLIRGRNVSKVVDENGEPLVVYHGSDKKFTTFDSQYQKGNIWGFNNMVDQFYFSPNKDLAERYSDKHNGKLYEVFLNIKTLDIEPESRRDDWKINDGYIFKQGNKIREIVVHNPNQIKSATDNTGEYSRFNNNIYDEEVNDYIVLTNALEKLGSLYGLTFNPVSNVELNSDKWRQIMPLGNLVNAFIYDNLIYINTDNSKVDAPLHEMMHIFAGSMRFTDPKLYYSLVSLMELLPNYEALSRNYRNRSRNDVNEEIFVTEVSKYLTNQESAFDNLEDSVKYEIEYNTRRVLDSILMGKDSVKTLSNDKLFNLSLAEVAKLVQSSITINKFKGTLNVENSDFNRRLNNMKSLLILEGTLKEDCI